MGWVDFGSVFCYKNKYWFIEYSKEHTSKMPFFSDFEKTGDTLHFNLTNRYINKLSHVMFWRKLIGDYCEYLTLDNVFWNRIPHWKVPIITEGCRPVEIKLNIDDDIDLSNRALKLFVFGYEHTQNYFTFEREDKKTYYSLDNFTKLIFSEKFSFGKDKKQELEQSREHYSKLMKMDYWDKIKNWDGSNPETWLIS